MIPPRRSVALFAVGFMLAGCDSASDQPAHTITTATSDDGVRTTTATFATDGGTATLQSHDGDSGALPLNLPLFPDATVIRSASFARGDTRTHFVVLRSDAEPVVLTAFYEAAAMQAGLTVETGLPGGDMPMLAASGVNGARLTLTTHHDEDGPTTVQMLVAEAP